MSKNKKKENNLINNDDSKNINKINPLELTEDKNSNDNKMHKLNLKSFEESIDNNNNDIELEKDNKKLPKNVMISDNVHVIQVESWKKYNQLQNMEPNLGLLGINDDSNNDGNNKVKRNTKDDVRCGCLII